MSDIRDHVPFPPEDNLAVHEHRNNYTEILPQIHLSSYNIAAPLDNTPGLTMAMNLLAMEGLIDILDMGIAMKFLNPALQETWKIVLGQIQTIQANQQKALRGPSN